MKWLPFLILFVLSSCKSQQVDEVKDDRLQLIYQSDFFPVDSAQTLIIRDQKSLNKFYSKLNKTRKPGIPIPSVDFSEKWVLVACLGASKNVSVPKMEVNKETSVSIEIGVERTKKNALTSTENYPVCLYSFPITDKKLTIHLD